MGETEGETDLWYGSKIGGQASKLWGSALTIGPPAVWVGGGIGKVCPVAFEGGRLVTIWGNVGYLRLNALVFGKGIVIVCDDGRWCPNGGELSGCYCLTDGGIVVGRALGGCVWQG